MKETIDSPLTAALAKKFGMPDSVRLAKILETILSSDEIRLLLNMPFDISEPKKVDAILEGMEMSPDSADAMLKDLYHRGVVAVGRYEGNEPMWFVPSLGILMDSTHWDSRYDQYGDEYYDLWRELVNEEILPATVYPEDTGFHIIPIEEPIPLEDTRQVVTYETAQSMIRDSDRIVILPCPCRIRERKCDAPLEACISLNEFAGYFLSRGMGREIDKTEALSILANCEAQGLVHQIPTGDHPDVICNCCSCCCIILRTFEITNSTPLLGSGYRPELDEQKCIGCLACVEACPFNALTGEAGKPLLIPENCLGCGLCVTQCPETALRLVEGETPLRKTRSDTLGGRFQYSHIFSKSNTEGT